MMRWTLVVWTVVAALGLAGCRGMNAVRKNETSGVPSAKTEVAVSQVQPCPPQECPECPPCQNQNYTPDDWKYDESTTRLGAEDQWPKVDLDGDGKEEAIVAEVQDKVYRLSVTDGTTGKVTTVEWKDTVGEQTMGEAISGFGTLDIDRADKARQLYVCFGVYDEGRRCHVVEYRSGQVHKVGSVGDGIYTDGAGHVFGTEMFFDLWRASGGARYRPGKDLEHITGDLFSMTMVFHGGGRIRKEIGGPVWWTTTMTLKAVAVSTRHKQRWYLVTWGNDHLGWVPHDEMYPNGDPSAQ
jgi:hypothetical protein